MTGKAGRVVSVVTTVIVALFLVVAVFALAVTLVYRVQGETAELFGYQLRVVTSGSMEPNIKQGALVAIRTAEEGDESFYEDLEVGDVLTFYWFNGATSADEVVVTHRIVNIQESDGRYVFTLRGDAVENDTQTIAGDSGNIIGKVTWDSYVVGRILTFVRSSVGIVCCLILPAAVVICFEVVRIVKLVREGKEEQKKEKAQEEESELERLRREVAALKEEKRAAAVQNADSGAVSEKVGAESAPQMPLFADWQDSPEEQGEIPSVAEDAVSFGGTDHIQTDQEKGEEER